MLSAEMFVYITLLVLLTVTQSGIQGRSINSENAQCGYEVILKLKHYYTKKKFTFTI